MNLRQDFLSLRPHGRPAAWLAVALAVLLAGSNAAGDSRAKSRAPAKPAVPDKPANAAAADTADQVQPEGRARRLGQLYEEVAKLLDDQADAAKALEYLKQKEAEPMAARRVVLQKLQVVAAQEALRRDPAAYSLAMGQRTSGLQMQSQMMAELQQLAGQENLLRGQLAQIQQAMETLGRDEQAALQRRQQLQQALKEDLPKKEMEWLWLCDPFGKLGKSVHQESESLFSRQIADGRKLALPYAGRGFDYFHGEQYAPALNDFAKVVDDETLGDAATAAIAWTYTRMHRLTEAHQQFAKVAKSKSAFVEIVLGHICAELKKKSLAEQHFRKAVSFGDRLPQAAEALAFFLATQRLGGNSSGPKQAVKNATKACELTDWSQWVYLDTLALACAAAGDYSLASQWGEKALQRAPAQYHSDLQDRLKHYGAKEPYEPE
jgi:hypothetical protein